MNILSLTSAYPHPDDGNEVVTPTVKYFCEKWAENGHNVIVIHNCSCFPKVFYLVSGKTKEKLSSWLGHSLPSKTSRQPLNYRKKNLLVERVPMVKLVPHGKFSKRIINKQVKNIIDILSREKFVPDVIVSHWVNPQIDLMIRLKKEFPNARYSLVFHDDCSKTTIKRFDLQERIKLIDAIGCRSKSYAQYVQKKLNLPKQPFICYSGIPDELATEFEDEIETREYLDTPEYIYVGRLVKYKNVDTIIEALHQVYAEKPFIFHIVGTGAERINLEGLVKKYGMEDRVFFHGQISREKVFKLMKHSTYFVMVSEHETFGMVYIEAMLAGCITVASIGGGVDGIIRNGENGFLSHEGNLSELENLLKKMNVMDVKDKERIRKNAINTAKCFSDKNVASAYLEDVERW